MITTVDKLRKTFALFLLSAVALATAGCAEECAYSNATSIAPEGWSKDNLVDFTYTSADTAGRYDIIIDVRNNEAYPFQNFWLFVQSFSPDGIEYTDTLECVLADNYGRWIGKSSGSMHTLPVMFLSDVQFPKKGDYRFRLAQGMRTDTLCGIQEIGIRIKKHENQER